MQEPTKECDYMFLSPGSASMAFNFLPDPTLELHTAGRRPQQLAEE
jgi:hypothetical protein